MAGRRHAAKIMVPFYAFVGDIGVPKIVKSEILNPCPLAGFGEAHLDISNSQALEGKHRHVW
jgi:hypothetical protein